MSEALDEDLLPKKNKSTIRLPGGKEKKGKPYKEVTLPLYLCWLKDIGLKTGFDLTCPTSTISIFFTTSEERELWWNKLEESIASCVSRQPNMIDVATNAASTLLIRYGAFQFGTTDSYEGWWNSGKISGKGKYMCDGCTYSGTFDNGWRAGVGLITYKSGTAYSGSWKAGRPRLYSFSPTNQTSLFPLFSQT